MPIRYADDFIVLVTTADGDPELCRIAAEQEKSALGEMLLGELGLSLSPEKTLVNVRSVGAMVRLFRSR